MARRLFFKSVRLCRRDCAGRLVETLVATLATAWYIDMVKERHAAVDASPFEGHWAAVTDGTWKLVRSTAGATRLYFLPEDPAEG